jgi:hypothetical protein
MADTLQEFLVSLKYQQDEASARRMLDGVKTTESKLGSMAKMSAKAGAAILGMGVMAAKGTLKYASAMEQVNFTAQRTHTTIARLIALQKTAASFGSSAGGAQGSIEGVAGFIRNNPGSGAFLSSIGVKLKDNKGHERDTVAIMKDLAHAFRAMPQYRANQYASMLGIDENTELAMRKKGFVASLDKYEAAEGKNMGKAGAGAHATMNQYRLAGAHVQGDQATAELTPMAILTKTLEKSNKLMGENNKWLDGLIGELTVVGAPIAEIGAAFVAMGLAKKLLAGRAVAAEAGAEAGAGAGAGAGAAAEIAGISWLGVGAAGIGALLYPHELAGPDQDQVGPIATHSQKVGNSLVLNANRRHAVARLMKDGLSQPEAIGMAAQFERESGYNAHAVGDNGAAYGIAQWHPDRQRAFKAMFGYTMNNASINDEIDFAAHELKSRPEWKKMQAAGNHLNRLTEIATRDYERPGDMAGEISKRQAIAQNINTTINVRSTDPKLTAKEVEHAQVRVNRQNAHNSSGAVR